MTCMIFQYNSAPKMVLFSPKHTNKFPYWDFLVLRMAALIRLSREGES